MSVTVSSWVWAHSSAGGTDRLVLLAIADEADDTGANAWPSIRRLAAKTRTSERTVKRAIRSLVDLGELEVHVGAGGTPDWRADRRPNLYRVIMSDGVPDRHPALGGDSDGHAPQGTSGPSVDGVPDRHPVEVHGVTPVVERGDTGVTQPTHTREENPCADTSAPKRDLLWEAMLAACGLDGRTPTRSERGAWNRAAKDLRDVDATPEEVHRRAQAFRQRWPHVSLTPTALARRWSEVVAGDTLPPPERTTDPDARRRSIENHARTLAAAGLDRVEATLVAELENDTEAEWFRVAFDAQARELAS